MNLARVLTNHARFSPDRTAVVFGGQRLSFSQFNERVNRLANALIRRGIKKGDKIACVTPNCLEMMDLYWATAKIGAVSVPLSPLLNGSGIKGLVEHSNSVLAFLSADAARELDPSGPHNLSIPVANRIIVGKGGLGGHRSYEDFISGTSTDEPALCDVEGSAPLMIVYSSGTTGEPKGIVLSHYARSMYCTLYSTAWRMTPESVSLHTGSLVFNGAFMTLLPSFFLGSRYILHEVFDPEEILRTIEREKVTHMVMVPSQIIALLDCPSFDTARLISLEALISLGATLHLSHKQRLLDVLGERFYEMYGLAEGFMTILDKTTARSKLASVGTPPPFFEMRIVKDGKSAPPHTIGEIVGRGPIMMEGYHQRPDLTDKAVVDGWLHSGDVGYVDEEGYLYLSDRMKDMIKSGGVSVYPRDIEEVIVKHPAVQEAAVFGVPHEKWGETPVAAVVLNPEHGKRTPIAELKSWINQNVGAKFQRIADLIVLDDFPRNAAGKTLKRTIMEAYINNPVHPT